MWDTPYRKPQSKDIKFAIGTSLENLFDNQDSLCLLVISFSTNISLIIKCQGEWSSGLSMLMVSIGLNVLKTVLEDKVRLLWLHACGIVHLKAPEETCTYCTG